MHFSTLFSAAALVQVALSKPASGLKALDIHNHGHAAQLQKRAGEVITTGAVGLGDDSVHSRLEINDLSSRPVMWSLYIRAMARWKEVPATDPTGYYGVSTVHGVPRENYNGVEQCDSCQGADGYCTHDSVLFPAWHRAYLALYEQEMIKVALDVANSFDGDFGDQMKAAAQQIRIPYWDWAASPDSGDAVLPPTLSGQQVTIAGPNGDETVDNPLYSYHFDDPSNMYYSPFTTWADTMRYPTSSDPSATSQNQQAVDAFGNLQQNLQDQVYQLLTACQDYLGFATDDASNNACANSIEGIHNTVHTVSGGAGGNGVSGGHMTYLPLASFDPIFWIHHANVDRIFAMWHTVHDAYGASQVAPHATWTIAAGSTQDANSPLMPFRKTVDSYWTTNDIKDFEMTFKYTYPEFVVGADQSSATVADFINRLYGANADVTSSQLSALAETGSNTNGNAANADPARDVSGAVDSKNTKDSEGGLGLGFGIGLGSISMSLNLPFGSKPTAASSSSGLPYPKVTGAWNGTKTTAAYPGPTGTGLPSSSGGNMTINPAFMAPNGSVYQYQCNVDTPRYAFNGSYVVYVFDGQPSSNDSSTWLGDDGCIGQIGILAGGDMASMDTLSSGSVPVTRHLQKMYKAGKISGLSEDVVVPYMTKNLNWKIVYQGQEVHPDALTGYKASFVSGLLSPITDGKLPTWSNLIPHVDVTKGKAGGITQLVDNIIGGVGQTLGGLGGDSSSPAGYGSGGSAASPPAGYAPHNTEDSPVPATTPAPSGPATYPPEEETTTTVYETHYVTYCPCTETLTTAALPNATPYAQAY